jgi:hypothetical protein
MIIPLPHFRPPILVISIHTARRSHRRRTEALSTSHDFVKWRGHPHRGNHSRQPCHLERIYTVCPNTHAPRGPAHSSPWNAARAPRNQRSTEAGVIGSTVRALDTGNPIREAHTGINEVDRDSMTSRVGRSRISLSLPPLCSLLFFFPLPPYASLGVLRSLPGTGSTTYCACLQASPQTSVCDSQPQEMTAAIPFACHVTQCTAFSCHFLFTVCPILEYVMLGRSSVAQSIRNQSTQNVCRHLIYTIWHDGMMSISKYIFLPEQRHCFLLYL